MKTNINKVFHVEEPIGKVWDHLSNPNKIVTCVPGASLTEQIDDRNYKGAVTLKFGPVKASYNGKITFEELDDANYVMKLNGKGLDVKGKGSADMLMDGKLTEKDGGTEVDVNMEITITGKLAQFGARLITEVSNSVFDQFVANFKNKLKESLTPETAPIVEEVAEIVEETVVEKVEDVIEKPVITATEKIEPKPVTPAQQEDNSLNAMSLLWTMVKGMVARLFK